MAQLKDLYSLEGVEQSGGSIYRYQDGKNVELAAYENGLWQITAAGQELLANPPAKSKKPKAAAPAPDSGELDLG